MVSWSNGFDGVDKLMKLVKFQTTFNHENQLPDFDLDPVRRMLKFAKGPEITPSQYSTDHD
jgi:hypothetical protein